MAVPSINEAVEFGDLYGIPEEVVHNWYEYSEGKKWLVGGTPMGNWKGALMKFNGRRLRLINAQIKLNQGGRNGY